MLDANFRLKLKDRDIKSDPALGSGLAYYVEENAYHEYLKGCPEQTEVRTLQIVPSSQLKHTLPGKIL